MTGNHIMSIFNLERHGDSIEIIIECDSVKVDISFLIETTIANYVDKGMQVILNMQKVNYISSTTMGMLLSLTLKFAEIKKANLFKIINVNERIVKILEISNIYDRLPIIG